MSNKAKLLTSAVSAVAPDPFGGLTEPLLTNKHEDKVGDEHCEEKDSWSSFSFIIGAIILGAAGVAASGVAMVTAGMIVVHVAGGICVATSAVIVRNQYELSKGGGYRAGINSLRKVANRLSEQSELLAQAVNELEAEADVMQAMEDQLSDIAREQGANAAAIVSLVRENEDILSKRKANLKQVFASDVARIFISSEFIQGDKEIDLKKLPVLIIRLQIQLDAHGMRLNTKKFTELVNRRNDVGRILKICGNMLSLDQKGNDDCDTMDLVTLKPEYSKGSVEIARGMAPKLSNTNTTLKHRNTVVRDVKKGLSMKLVTLLKSNVEQKDRKYRLTTYRNCFIGKEAVDFLVQTRYASSRGVAVALGQSVMEETKAFEHVTGDHPFEDKQLFYHFVEMEDVGGGDIGIDSDDGDVYDPTHFKGNPESRSIMTGVPESSERLRSSLIHSDDEQSVSSIGLETRSSDKEMAIIESLTEMDVEASVSSSDSQARIKRGPSNVTTKELVALLKSNVEQKDRTYRLKTYPNCFIGREAVDFLIHNRYAPTREDAVILGRSVMKKTKAFKHVTGDHTFEDRYLFYRFVKKRRGAAVDGASTTSSGSRRFRRGDSMPIQRASGEGSRKIRRAATMGEGKRSEASSSVDGGVKRSSDK